MDAFSLDINFFRRDATLIDTCRSSAAPRTGDFVNIAGELWPVVSAYWHLDADADGTRTLRASVTLKPTTRTQLEQEKDKS